MMRNSFHGSQLFPAEHKQTFVLGETPVQMPEICFYPVTASEMVRQESMDFVRGGVDYWEMNLYRNNRTSYNFTNRDSLQRHLFGTRLMRY
jgi:hypothetical protein